MKIRLLLVLPFALAACGQDSTPAGKSTPPAAIETNSNKDIEKYYCREIPEEDKIWQILKSAESDFASATGKHYLIVRSSVAGGEIQRHDRMTISVSGSNLMVAQARGASTINEATLTLDGSGLWASGPDKSGAGEFFVYRLPAAGTPGGAPACRNGNAKTCKTLHFEYYKSGQYGSHKPVLGGNVNEVASASDCDGDLQNDDGDGDHGP